MAIPILLTRPLPASKRFAAQLRAQIDAKLHIVISPLLRIAPVDQRPELTEGQGLILTSANAVGVMAPGAGRRCYCVGSATTQAARAAGFDAVQAGQDADTLVASLRQNPPTMPLLHAHGRHVRGDVSKRLTDLGIPCSDAVVYEQLEEPLNEQALALLNGDQGVFVPFFSPRSAALFTIQHRGKAPLYVVSMSPAVTESLVDLPYAALEPAHKPEAAEIVAALRRLMDAAQVLEASKPRG